MLPIRTVVLNVGCEELRPSQRTERVVQKLHLSPCILYIQDANYVFSRRLLVLNLCARFCVYKAADIVIEHHRFFPKPRMSPRKVFAHIY
jgi:hypothetical protein